MKNILPQTGSVNRPRAVWTQRTFSFGLPSSMLVYYLERLQGTVYRLEAKVAGVPDEILSHQLDDKWSIKHNIGHLAELEEVSLIRIDEILRGISPLSPAVFPTKQDYNAQPVGQVLHYFKEKRSIHLEQYQELNEEQLKMSSLHPRLQVQMNPVDLAFFHAEHDDNHLVRINEILNTLNP